jgi:ppGpp synthetase/RelA/SpoT-type nucleotidyltranferase
MEDLAAITKILRDFEQRKFLLESFCEACERLAKQILEAENLRVHSVTSRVKDRGKLEEKIKRDGKDYGCLSEITDIVGVRIITHFEDEVDKAGTIIEREFSVDKNNSIDKRKMLDPDRFGYLSLHYVGTLREDRCRLAEYRPYIGIPCEIQIRSILQHAWAEIEHDLGYKAGAAVPAPIRRQFSRLAGLLELADTEFADIRDELSRYTARVHEQISKKPAQVDLDAVALSAFIQSDQLVINLDQKMAALAKGAKLEDPPSEAVQRLAEELQYAGYTTISDLQQALKSEQELLIAQYDRRMQDHADISSLYRGISLFQLFQITIAQTRGSAGLKEAFDKFVINAEASRDERVQRIFAIIADLKKRS